MNRFESAYENLEEEFLMEDDPSFESFNDESYDEAYGIDDEALDARLFRTFLGEEYAHAPDEEILEIFEESLANLSEEEAEIFGKIWRGIKKGAKYIAVKALPKITTAVGSIYGPAGAWVGGKVGSLVSGLVKKGLNRKKRRRATKQKKRKPAQKQIAHPAPTINPNSKAVNQLMSLLSNPILTQALLGQVIGKPSKKSVPLVSQGKQKNVSYGAVMDLLSVLAKKAAGEAYEINAEETPDYLMDSSGEFVYDPADDEARAKYLIEMINETSYWANDTTYEEDDDDEYYDDEGYYIENEDHYYN